LSANGKYLYVTGPNIAALTTLAVNSVTGALKYVTTTSDGVMDNHSPTGLATIRNGTLVFTGDYPHGVTPNMGIFSVGTKGSLTSLGTFPIAQGEVNAFPQWVAARAF
jgi:outer membrane protein assembly factor BamB